MYQEGKRKEPGRLDILLYLTGGRGLPWSRPAREHGVWITWPLWGTEIEDKAASRLLSGLAVPQGEVVHGEHAGLVFRGQELPARREIWFLPSYLGTCVSPFLPYTVVLAGPREQLPSVLVDLQVENMSS